MPQSPLDDLSIAAPCTADWNEMQGDDQRRFCSQCQLNVYNLSGMTHDAAERLIQESEGRLCVRFFRRTDGTVITQDCPVGLKTLHQRKIKRFGPVAAAVTLVTVMGIFTAQAYAEANEPFQGNAVTREIMGQAVAPHQKPMTQGGIAPVKASGQTPGVLSVKKTCKKPPKKEKTPKKPPVIPALGSQQSQPNQAMMGKIAFPPPQQQPEPPPAK